MSIRTRLIDRLRARIARPLLEPLTADRDRLREMVARMKADLDDARRDLGHAYDETTRLSLALDDLQVERARDLEAPAPKPTRPVPEARRMAVLRVADQLTFYPTAVQLAKRLLDLDLPALNGCGLSRLGEIVRQVVDDGWMESTATRGGMLVITDKGRTALGVELVGVAS